MERVWYVRTRVLPGSRIEITAPELAEGSEVEAFLIVRRASPKRQSMLELVEPLPPRPLLFKTAEEVDRYIQEERDSWDRHDD